MNNVEKLNDLRTVFFAEYNQALTHLLDIFRAENNSLNKVDVLESTVEFIEDYFSFSIEHLVEDIQSNAMEFGYRISDGEAKSYINHFSNVLYNFLLEFDSKWFFEGCLCGYILANEISSNIENKTLEIIVSDYPGIGVVVFRLASGIKIQIWTESGSLNGLDCISKNGQSYFFDGINSNFHITDLLDTSIEKAFINIINI